MFKLQRPNNRPSNSKPREKLDFKLSNFQALQVPKGWDRLFVSLISVETGKTIAKLGKTLVRNGSCQWTEILSESIWISRDDSSKEYEESLIKIVLSTGSTRSSRLGEATVNMANFISSRVSAAVSLPLKKCSYGTVLLVKIQCLTPRSKTRDEESKSSSSQEKELNPVFGSQSNGSEKLSDPIGPQSQDQASTSRPLRLDSKKTSQSTSSPNHSFNSTESSIEGGNLFTRNALKTEYKYDERQPGGRFDDSPISDKYSVDNDSPSNQASSNTRQNLREDLPNETTVNRSLANNFGSSKDLLEAAEDTIEELRAEAKMWERNSRKLMIDLDMSRKESSDLSKKQAGLVVELSAARAEDDSLKREVEQLKLELHQLTSKQANQENPTIQYERLIQIQKELEDEIKYQKDLNANLGQQLKQTQESNIELVSVLQELEEIIEQQKTEIENLSSLKLDFTDLENSVARISEDNRTLLLQLQQLQESEKTFQAEVLLLEESLRDKSIALEKERKSNREFLFHVEKDYMYKMSVKEEEVNRLEAELTSHSKTEVSEVLHDTAENNVDIIESLKEKIQELEKDCSELTDENLELLFKLKDSNKTEIRECASFDSLSGEDPTVSPSDESEVSDDPEFQISIIEENLKKKVNEEMQNFGFEISEQLTEISKQLEVAFDLLMKPWCIISSKASEESHHFIDVNASKGNAIKELSAEHVLSSLLELNKLLEMRITECDKICRHDETEINQRNSIIADVKMKMEDCLLDMEEHEQSKAKAEENYADIVKELDKKISELDLIKANFLSKEEEAEFLLQHQKELQEKVLELQQRNSRVEQNCEVVLSEKNVASECVEKLQSDLTVLLNTVDSHVSTITNLEKKLEEFEREMHDSEISLSGLQDENMQLQERISILEAGTRHLSDEKDYSESVAVSLQDEIQKLKDEFEIQLLDLKQTSEDMEKQWLRAQEECGYLKTENQKLQVSATSLIEDSMKLQSSNSELNEKNQELREHCSELASQLNQAKQTMFDCDKKVEFLENHLTSVVKDFSFRESNLISELDALVQENNSQKQKLDLVILENTTEFESLQKEVDHLKRQIADAHEETEIISFETTGEVSRLLADRAELQASFQEVQSKAESTKNELGAVQLKYETKVHGLISQLAASQQSDGKLMADHERVLKSLANYRKSEEKLKTEMNNLELKLTISEYERQQLTKDMVALKVQLQQISSLHNEISILKRELKECRLDNSKLELALQTVSGDYEELNAEKISLSEKMSILQGIMSEFEECKSEKSALEEKLLLMENELAVKEILHAQNSELKNELTAIKRANMQFQQKLYRLEEEKEDCRRKAQSLEEEIKEKFNSHKEVTYDNHFHDERPFAMASKENRVQHESFSSSGPNNYSVVSKKSVDDGQVVPRQKYERTKSSLETELRDLRERYLKMSLKYAEVESQREDLVMKLKANRGGKRWFS